MLPFLSGAVAQADEPLYVEDVFSAYTYTGTGAARAIQNGIDLDGEGGLVWMKNRAGASWDHWLVDSARGPAWNLSTNITNAQQSSGIISSFNGDGFTLASDVSGRANYTGVTYGSWTFRKAPKFFDIVTYTGNGVAGRQIAHDLGIAPGMIIVKKLDTNEDWVVWHRSATGWLHLNLTDAQGGSQPYITTATSSTFTVATGNKVNGNGSTYVAYLFAHDDSDEGIIQCGAVGSGVFANLGWEPQFVLFKPYDGAVDWRIVDSSRAFTTSNDEVLAPNTTAAAASSDYITPTASGFTIGGSGYNYVYMAIRKGNMRVPTDATKVFAIDASTGNGSSRTISGLSITTGPDLYIVKKRIDTNARPATMSDRLRGASGQLMASETSAQTTMTTMVTSFNMDGVSLSNYSNANQAAHTYINYFFKQARGFLDIVAYTGTGTAKTEAHNLGVVPDLMIVKSTSSIVNWSVYYGDATKSAILNSNIFVASGSTYWNNTAPTETVFSVGTSSETNSSGASYINYLFASCPGVSDMGTYTGTGAANSINCGFSAGARFVMIRRVDSVGDWYYWDTVRGIISGSEPYMVMNNDFGDVAAVDYIAPYSPGFQVTAAAPAALNASGGTYLYLVIA